MRAAVAQQVMPKLLKPGEPCWWIIDDMGHPKKGNKSVGVGRQYCGRLGKTDNCQVAVSLSLAMAQGSLPLDYRLYLPREWIDDRARCEAAGVPAQADFLSKGQIARAQIQAALERGLARGVVLADAAYGNEAAFRDWLSERQLDYVLGVRVTTQVWWGPHQPAPVDPAARGHPRIRLQRDAQHQPIDVLALARALPARQWRSLTGREGTNAPLRSRFARVRVRAAQANRPRAEEWLLIEWPANEPEPVHYWLSTLPQDRPSRPWSTTPWADGGSSATTRS